MDSKEIARKLSQIMLRGEATLGKGHDTLAEEAETHKDSFIKLNNKLLISSIYFDDCIYILALVPSGSMAVPVLITDRKLWDTMKTFNHEVIIRDSIALDNLKRFEIEITQAELFLGLKNELPYLGVSDGEELIMFELGNSTRFSPSDYPCATALDYAGFLVAHKIITREKAELLKSYADNIREDYNANDLLVSEDMEGLSVPHIYSINRVHKGFYPLKATLVELLTPEQTPKEVYTLNNEGVLCTISLDAYDGLPDFKAVLLRQSKVYKCLELAVRESLIFKVVGGGIDV